MNNSVSEAIFALEDREERIFISGFRRHLAPSTDFSLRSPPASSLSDLRLLQRGEGGEEPGQSSLFSLQV